MVQSEVSSQATIKKAKATIMSLPLEVDFMIIKWLHIKDALNMAKALKLPEQVAVQYFDCEEVDIYNIFDENQMDDLQPSSFKFLLKNKGFQRYAILNQKTNAAVRTLDLDFLKKYLEQYKPDLNYALVEAVIWDFTDAFKLLLSDSRVNPSAQNNLAVRVASMYGHFEIVKLLLADDRVNPSAQNNQAFIDASGNGHLETVKLLLKDARVDPSAVENLAVRVASHNGHLDIVKLLLSDSRVDQSAQNNTALGFSKVTPPY